MTALAFNFAGNKSNYSMLIIDDESDEVTCPPINVINTGNSYSKGICDSDKVGIRILIKRTVGYYDVSVRNRYMMMDLLAEIFAI